MTGSRCAVSGCPSKSNGNNRDSEVTFHQFPKDKKLQRTWITKCYSIFKINPTWAKICSNHFDDGSYVRDLKAELLGLKSQKKLEATAIPSINLPVKQTVGRKISPEKESRDRIKERKDIIDKILKDHEENLYSYDEKIVNHLKKETEENHNIGTNDIKIHDSTSSANVTTGNNEEPVVANVTNNEESAVCNYVKKETKNKLMTIMKQKRVLEMKYSNLKFQNMKRIKKIKSLKCELLQAQLSFRRAKQDIKILVKEKKENNLIRNKSMNVLNEVFSPAQVKMLLGKLKVKWSQEDIAKAFTLWCLSKRAYSYLRDRCKMPLPHICTLQRYAANLEKLPN